MKKVINPKILFILPSLRGGGAERAVLNLINNLDEQRFKLQLAVLNLEGEYLDSLREGIKVFNLKTPRARYAIFKLTKLINKEKPDIVFGTIEQIRILLYFIKKISRHKPIFIARCESFQSKVKYKKIIKFLSYLSLRNSDYVIALSEKMVDDLVKRVHVKKEKIKLIYNPVDLENIQKLANEDVEENYFSEKPVILSCGRLSEPKGFSYLIEAFPFILKKYPQAKLLIIGEKGEKEIELKNLVKKLKIEDRVKFLNWQKNPFKFMARADIFVSSSLWESFTNVMIEAMALGIPVVSTDCVSPEILENGHLGILVPPANSKALAEGILKLLDNSDLRKELSEKSKQKAKDFDIKKNIKEYQDFFLEILEKKDEKTKITFFLPTLEGGGTEKSVIRLLQGLNKENFQTTLLLGKTGGHFFREVPERILVKKLNTLGVPFLLFKLIKYLQQEKPDIFVSFLSHVNVISVLAKIFSRTKTKLIVSERTTFSHTPEITKTTKNRLLASLFLKPLVKITYPLADAIVCVSKGVAEDISRFLPSSKINKVKVIYNPIVSHELYNLADQPVEHPWFSNQEIPVILAIGRLTKAKDYPTLLRAFALICKKKKSRLVILGEGEESKNLENLVHKLNLSESVTFLGFQKNPYKYMQKASVFVLSSKREGFPNVIVEAMALGVPVVSTNCQSGPNEVIKNGENGILVPVGNEKALAEAILKVLNNPSLQQKFSVEGKRRAQDFTLEKSVKKYETLFQEVLK